MTHCTVMDVLKDLYTNDEEFNHLVSQYKEVILLIQKITFVEIENTVIAHIHTHSGFSLVKEAHCANMSLYSISIGRKEALTKALIELITFNIFHKKQSLYLFLNTYNSSDTYPMNRFLK